MFGLSYFYFFYHMSQRDNREAVNRGCNCLIVLAIGFVMVVSGVRSCINGDLKLPRWGSKSVSGGSGGAGTSNGYNVEYKRTTAPNSNSSSRDYTHTNNQPTEYLEGTNMQRSNAVPNSSSKSNSSNSGVNSSSTSTVTNNSNRTTFSISKTYYKKCEWCQGKGTINSFEWFYESPSVILKCNKCGRSDTHRHDEIEECPSCEGSGKIKMIIVDGPLGETEMPSLGE